MTDKYTRTFSDFSNYPWPGKILPQYFEHGNYADGYRGTQGMLQHIVSAYGAYHIVEGPTGTIDGTEWTGAAAYGMFSGTVKELAAASGDLDDSGEFLIYNSDGSFAVTGDKPTGIILARNVKGTVYTAYRREDDNSKNYFPNDVYHYGGVNSYTGVLGHGDIISGYESVSADSGIFQHIEGFSDIEMGDSLDFGGSYHLKGVSQITGAIISGSQTTGTSGIFEDLEIDKYPSSVKKAARKQELYIGSGGLGEIIHEYLDEIEDDTWITPMLKLNITGYENLSGFSINYYIRSESNGTAVYAYFGVNNANYLTGTTTSQSYVNQTLTYEGNFNYGDVISLKMFTSSMNISCFVSGIRLYQTRYKDQVF